MSKQDTHFFNVFSVVLGLLVGFAIIVFAIARYVGKHEQNASLQSEPLLQQSVASRVSSPVRVAVAGQDNSALTIAPVATGTTAVLTVVLEDGAQVYEAACKACHAPAVAAVLGAPAAGDAAAWRPRIAQGKATLYQHAVQGFSSKPGSNMPAKGGRTDLSDELVHQAVDHLLSL